MRDQVCGLHYYSLNMSYLLLTNNEPYVLLIYIAYLDIVLIGREREIYKVYGSLQLIILLKIVVDRRWCSDQWLIKET